MPSVRPKNAYAHPSSKCHRLARPRAVVGKPAGQTHVVEMITDLLKDRDPPDANELRCFDLIRRFHRWGRRDTCHGLRLVTAHVEDSDGKRCLASDGRPVTRRYVLELACFEYRTGREWKLVVWGIDEESAAFKPLSSERLARAAFSSGPDAVLNVRPQ